MKTMQNKVSHTQQQVLLAKQQGFSTLAVILILLFMITSLTLYTSMVSVTEQKISSNEKRAMHALQTADAGMNHVTARITASLANAGILDADGDGCIDAARPDPSDPPDPNICVADRVLTGSVPPGVANSVFNYGATIVNPKKGDLTSLIVESVGCIDACDCQQMRKECPVHKTIAQTFVAMKPVSGSPVLPAVTTTMTPLIAFGNVTLSGSVNLTTANGDFAVINGGSFTVNDATPVLTNQLGAVSPVEAPPVNSGVFNLPGAPVVVSSNIDFGSRSDFFLTFIGDEFAAAQTNTSEHVLNMIRNMGVNLECNALCVDADLNNAMTLAAANSVNSQIIFVNGDLMLANNAVLGTVAAPVLLIVEGDLQITAANKTINGMVYVVRPNANPVWTVPVAGGGLTINGSLVVEGAMVSTGSLNVVSDIDVSTVLSNIMLVQRVPGTWQEL